MRPIGVRMLVAGLVTIGALGAAGGAAAARQAAPSPLSVSVLVDGQPAERPGPEVPTGEEITFTYTIVNESAEPLWAVYLWDDAIGHVPCPDRRLEPGQETVCAATVTAGVGEYQSTARVWAWTGDGGEVAATVLLGYRAVGAEASIDLSVRAAGEDAGLPGPELSAGESVRFDYLVRNDGDYRLWAVFVWDDELGRADCADRRLDPGDVTVCSIDAVAGRGDYQSSATVWAWDDRGGTVEAAAAFGYRSSSPAEPPSLRMVPLVSDARADVSPGPSFTAPGSLTWTFRLENTGGGDLWAPFVWDRDLGRVNCAQRRIRPGDAIDCVVETAGELGPVSGFVEAKAWADDGTEVEDETQRFAVGLLDGPGIEIETTVDGYDADAPAGPRRLVDSRIDLGYLITNVGSVALESVTVVDESLGAVDCPADTLSPGQSMSCSMTAPNTWGDYQTAGSVSAVHAGGTVGDSDPTFWHVRNNARVSRFDFEVSVGDADADVPPGPELPAGSSVEIVYWMGNSGNSMLWAVEVRDPLVPFAEMDCEGNDNLLPGEMKTCRATVVVPAGLTVHLPQVVGWNNDGDRAVAEDPVHFTGI